MVAGCAVAGWNGTPLERFLRKCRFDPLTGCTLWIGGTTQGRGHSAPYGSFWFEGRRWFAHRWAAKYIHGLDIADRQVDHCCVERVGLPAAQTLCVDHLQAIPPAINRELQWIRAQVGLNPTPPLFDRAPIVAFLGNAHDAPCDRPHQPPIWLNSPQSAPPTHRSRPESASVER